MTIEPKPYLDYLDKEMTIMGLLSAFSVALGSLATEKIISAEQGFFSYLWLGGRDHVIAGAATAVLAAFFFYLQRAHLAWLYGQIALAQSRHGRVDDWLARADGWDTWVRYHTGFILLTLSSASYAYAVTETLNPCLAKISPLGSLCLPLLVTLLFIAWRWYVLVKFPQEDKPFRAWWRSLRTA